jgi:23S rRNA pseudouridine955/2504/2580 synthase
MFLHAQRISFAHPVTGATMTIESPLPAELAAFIARLDAGVEGAIHA